MYLRDDQGTFGVRMSSIRMKIAKMKAGCAAEEEEEEGGRHLKLAPICNTS